MKKWAVFLSVVLGLLFALPVAAQGWSVILWYGTPEELPANWQVCDGTNGTPDMRDRFIAGAGSTYALGETGGSATVDASHVHGVGTLDAEAVGTHDHSFSTSSSDTGAHTHSIELDTDTEFGSIGVSSGGSTAANNQHTHHISGYTASDGSHIHTVSGTTGSDGAHDHTLSGDTAESLTTTLSIMPPYLAAYYVCYSGTLALSTAITDPLTTNYYTTTEGIVYSKVRTVTTEGEVTNYLLGGLVVLGIVYLLAWAVLEGKRRWS